ncbi:uncharacterized protein LOC143077944 [Mytilus galloprovincialis]|uniref:uncharacterized protein LOC143077944 n=1 Tax=Mytilus galloprovincialis TaxID=29158 RepID=UPI003F7BA60F
MTRLHVIILIGAIAFSTGSYLRKRNRECGSECIRDEHCDQGSVCERTTDRCRRHICVKTILEVPQVIVDTKPIRGDVYEEHDQTLAVSPLDLPIPMSPLGRSDIGKNGKKPWLIDPNISTLTKTVNPQIGSENTLTGSMNADLLQICINNCLMRSTCLQGTDCRFPCETSCLNELSNVNLTPSLSKSSIVPLELGPNGQILQASTKTKILGNLNTEFVSGNQQDEINHMGQNEMVSSIKPIGSYISSDSLGSQKEINDYALTDSPGNKNVVASVQSIDKYVPNDSTEPKEGVPFVKTIDNYVSDDLQDHKVVMNRFTNVITSDGLRGGFVDKNGNVQQIDPISLGKQTNTYDPKDSTGKKEILQSNPIIKSDHSVLIDPNFGTITKFETSNGGFVNEMDKHHSGSNNADLLNICIDNCVATSRCVENDCRPGCKKLCLNELPLINTRASLPEVQEVFRQHDQMNQNMHVGTGREVVGEFTTDMVSKNKDTGREIVHQGNPVDTYVQQDLPVHKLVGGGRGGDLVHKSQLQKVEHFSPGQLTDDFIPQDVNADVMFDTLATSKNVGLLQICIDNCLAQTLCLQGTDCSLHCKNICLNELPNTEFNPSLPKGSVVPFVDGQNAEIIHAEGRKVLTSNSGIHGGQAIHIDPNSGTLTSMFKSSVDQSSPVNFVDAYVPNNLQGHKEVVAPVKTIDTYVQENLKKQNGVKPILEPFESVNQHELPEHTEVVNRLTQVITSNGQRVGLVHNRHIQQHDNFSPVEKIDNYVPTDVSGQEILTSNPVLHNQQKIIIDPNSGAIATSLHKSVGKSYGNQQVQQHIITNDQIVLDQHTGTGNQLVEHVEGDRLVTNHQVNQFDQKSPVEPIDIYIPNNAQKIPSVGKLQKPILPLISNGPFGNNRNGNKIPNIGKKLQKPILPLFSKGNNKSKCNRDCPRGRVCATRRGRSVCIRKKLGNNYRKM